LEIRHGVYPKFAVKSFLWDNRPMRNKALRQLVSFTIFWSLSFHSFLVVLPVLCG